MFVPGKGVVFAEYTDPVGNKHKLHKDCYKNGGYGGKAETASPVGENVGDGEYDRRQEATWKDSD